MSINRKFTESFVHINAFTHANINDKIIKRCATPNSVVHIATAKVQSNLTQLNRKLVLQGYWCVTHHPTHHPHTHTFRPPPDNLGS